MKKLRLFGIPGVLAIAVLGFLGQGATQAAYIHTTEAGFLHYTQPGFYLEEFSGLSPGWYYDTPMEFSGGNPGFSYSISADGGFYVVDQASGNPSLSVNNSGSDLVIAITSGNATSVGGQFFLTDVSGGFAGGELVVNLSDHTSVTITSSVGDFLGFTTTPAGPFITSLIVHSDDQGAYVTMDHFYVGADEAVPEPTTLIAGALLLLPFGMSTLRKLRRNRTA